MSGEAVGWAFRKVQMDDPTAKFVLVAICNYADANDKAWPSHSDISRVTGLSKRAVQNSIKKLVDWGVVSRVREFRQNGSENNPTVYLDLESRPVVVDGVASGTTPPLQDSQPDVESGAILQTTDTKPQERISVLKAKKEDVYSEDFEGIWTLAASLGAPRTKNTSKKKAWGIYRMLNSDRQAMVRVAIPAFAAAMRAEGRPPDKIKHLQFWLSDGMYETAIVSAPRPDGAPPAEPWHKTASREQWAKVLTQWSATSDWRAAWGPSPDHPGCSVPADMIAAHNVKHRGFMFSNEQLDDFRKAAQAVQ